MAIQNSKAPVRADLEPRGLAAGPRWWLPHLLASAIEPIASCRQPALYLNSIRTSKHILTPLNGQRLTICLGWAHLVPVKLETRHYAPSTSVHRRRFSGGHTSGILLEHYEVSNAISLI